MCLKATTLAELQSVLTSHMNVHTSKYKCSDCGKCCQNNLALTVHRRTHSGEKPFECSDCGKQFTMAGSLVKHCTHIRPWLVIMSMLSDIITISFSLCYKATFTYNIHNVTHYPEQQQLMEDFTTLL